MSITLLKSLGAAFALAVGAASGTALAQEQKASPKKEWYETNPRTTESKQDLRLQRIATEYLAGKGYTVVAPTFIDMGVNLIKPIAMRFIVKDKAGKMFEAELGCPKDGGIICQDLKVFAQGQRDVARLVRTAEAAQKSALKAFEAHGFDVLSLQQFEVLPVNGGVLHTLATYVLKPKDNSYVVSARVTCDADGTRCSGFQTGGAYGLNGRVQPKDYPMAPPAPPKPVTPPQRK